MRECMGSFNEFAGKNILITGGLGFIWLGFAWTF